MARLLALLVAGVSAARATASTLAQVVGAALVFVGLLELAGFAWAVLAAGGVLVAVGSLVEASTLARVAAVRREHERRMRAVS